MTFISRRFYKPFVTALFLLLAALIYTGAPGLARAAAVDALVPHKALYDIKMVAKRSGSQVLNISGKMLFESKPVCNAWINDHRFSLLYEYAESPAMRVVSDFSTYEAYDGTSFDFNSQRKRNGEIYQELRGQAIVKKNGEGSAVYSKPEGLVFSLSEGTIFPMSHTVGVLKKAKAGKSFYSAIVFDGSDEDGPVEINTFIGKRVRALDYVTPSSYLDTDLIKTPAWSMRMAFFPLMEGAAESDYEMDVIFHDNGIISDMLVEYKDFSVTQKLIALEKLEAEKCE